MSVLYAWAQAPGPRPVSWNLRLVREVAVPLSDQVRRTLALALSGRVAGAVMGLVVSLLLYTLGLNRPGRPWVDRKITSPLRRRARARRRRPDRGRLECHAHVGVAALPHSRVRPGSSGPAVRGHACGPVSSRLSFDFQTSPEARVFRIKPQRRQRTAELEPHKATIVRASNPPRNISALSVA
jgi:hypothetical protein